MEIHYIFAGKLENRALDAFEKPLQFSSLNPDHTHTLWVGKEDNPWLREGTLMIDGSNLNIRFYDILLEDVPLCDAGVKMTAMYDAYQTSRSKEAYILIKDLMQRAVLWKHGGLCLDCNCVPASDYSSINISWYSEDIDLMMVNNYQPERYPQLDVYAVFGKKHAKVFVDAINIFCDMIINIKDFSDAAIGYHIVQSYTLAFTIGEIGYNSFILGLNDIIFREINKMVYSNTGRFRAWNTRRITTDSYYIEDLNVIKNFTGSWRKFGNSATQMNPDREQNNILYFNRIKDVFGNRDIYRPIADFDYPIVPENYAQAPLLFA